MKMLLKLVLLPAIFTFVESNFPIDPDVIVPWAPSSRSVEYRLPEVLEPIHYDIEVTPYFQATPFKEAFTFDGAVVIQVKALVENINHIIVHENVRHILSVTVTNMDGVPLLFNAMNPIERIRQYQFLRINLRDGVTLEKDVSYKIIVTYIGNMNETPLSRGVFRGSYRNKETGILHWYAATHLQPTHSRQAFPSFDEPGFKSTFSIVINRGASYIGTFSNMPVLSSVNMGDRVKETYMITPRMPAYLVTFHISEEFTMIAENDDPDRPYRILARPDAAGQGEYALEVGVKLTKWMEDYFDIPYYDMADNIKNDQIASPDWASGATENWGLVTYRELRLLYEHGETNILDKQSIGTITSHELAHKWFGNLVTCRWWDNVWINEGFASYFEYFGTYEVEPESELNDQFNIMYVQSALSADASTNTRALQHSVNTPEEVTGHFTGISYSKGASFLMMLKHFLTPETFQKALHYYLTDRSYQYAFPEHLSAAFAQAVAEDGVLQTFPDVDITSFMDIWVNEPGYPVLEVTRNTNTGRMVIRQERFFINENANPTSQIWPLPLTFTTGNNPNWNNRRATHVLLTSGDEIEGEAGDHWVIFNIKQNGLYRVNYDVRNWELIAEALESNPSSIDPLNRAQIVDDIFALMRSGMMKYELGFKVLQFLKQETNYYVWYPAIAGFTWLRNRLLHLPAVISEYDELTLQYMDKVITDLGFDEAETDSRTRILNRFFTMAFACNIGHEVCVNHAIENFNNLIASGPSVNPNLRRHVYCSGLLHGNLAAWEALYQRRQNSNNQADESVLLRALGCTTNPTAIGRYLDMILSNDVRAQDRVNAFTFLFMGSRNNAKIALPFIKERHNDIRDAVIGSVRFNSVLSSLASYLDEEGLDDMEQWLHSNSGIPEYSVGISAINSARSNMDWGTRKAAEIMRAVRGAAAAILPTTTLLLAALITIIYK